MSMDETQKTPGAWEASCAGLTRDGARIVLLYTGRPLANAVDDARLIEAAPELLEACKILESFASGFEDDEAQEQGSMRDMLAVARYAIAKAEGRL